MSNIVVVFCIAASVTVMLAGCQSQPQKASNYTVQDVPVAETRETVPRQERETENPETSTESSDKLAPSFEPRPTVNDTRTTTMPVARPAINLPTRTDERRVTEMPTKVSPRQQRVPEATPSTHKSLVKVKPPAVVAEKTQFKQSASPEIKSKKPVVPAAIPQPRKVVTPVVAEPSKTKPEATKPTPVDTAEVESDDDREPDVATAAVEKPVLPVEPIAPVAIEETSHPKNSSSLDAATAIPFDNEPKLAMIDKIEEPAVETSVESKLKGIEYDEDHLPIKLDGGWVLDIRPDQMGNDRRCLLYSKKTPIFDGRDTTSIRLQVTTDAIVVNSDANIDTSYPGLGMRVDSGKLMPFDPNLLNERTIRIVEPVQVAMTQGSKLNVFLGFWPTWPVTETQSTTIDLTGFKNAFSALKACSAAL